MDVLQAASAAAGRQKRAAIAGVGLAPADAAGRRLILPHPCLLLRLRLGLLLLLLRLAGCASRSAAGTPAGTPAVLAAHTQEAAAADGAGKLPCVHATLFHGESCTADAALSLAR